MDAANHLERQRQFSVRTFGPHSRPGRTAGIIDHLKKELEEVKKNPRDITEWIDLMILAADGAFSQGYSARDIVRAWEAKQTKIEGRSYPDWRTVEPGKAIEHIRSEESAARKAAETSGDQFGGFR